MLNKLKIKLFTIFENGVFIAMCIFVAFLLFLAINSYPSNDKMIDRAKPYLQTLQNKIKLYWNNAPYKYFIPAQIEQESLWKERAELKTSREYGFGLSQITVTSRFNKFLEAKKQYEELKRWCWDDRFSVDYQLTFIVLEDKHLFSSVNNLFSNNINRWAGALVGYNAGLDTVLNRRALCMVTDNCNYQLWFGGLNEVHLKYEDKLLYGRELWKMRNDYPEKIIFVLSNKYKGLI